MTRDEAIKIKLVQNDKLIAYGNLSNRVAAEHQIDTWVALGMLKLDEPKSAWDAFMHEMKRHGYSVRSVAVSDMAGALDRAGLKIVEK